jgi:prephenate dehydrogenase
MRPNQALTIAAVRGAATVPANDAPSILGGTAELLTALMSRNALRVDQVVSALFTVTADLDADFPAHAARRMGWDAVPMLCAREIPVPGALGHVVRVLLTVRVEQGRGPLWPAYLGRASALRPDLAPSPGSPERRIAIVGLGQIGGSIGLALRGRGWRRVGFDLDPGALSDAEAAGAIDARASGVADACAGAELALIAVPVDAAAAAIDAAAAALPRGAALLDTGSARGPITPVLAAARDRGIAALGGHPLAGTEGRGFAAARGDLFQGAAFALMPAGAPIPAIVEALLRDLGARPVMTDPSTHDRALARASHLPYLLSCALRDAGAGAVAAGLTGPGFRDMTRLAASDPRMAEAFCRANAAEVASAWEALRVDLDRRVAALAAGRSDR